MTISWSFYGEALSSDMGVTTQMLGDATNFLSIPSAGPSNQGNYTCIAKNSAGFDMYTSQLVVNGIKYDHLMKTAWSNIYYKQYWLLYHRNTNNSTA